MKNMFSLFKKYDGHLVLAMLAYAFIVLFAAILLPGFQKVIFDEVLEKKNLVNFIIMCASVVPMFFIISMAKMKFKIYKQRIKNEISGIMIERLMRGYYRLPYTEVQAKGEDYYASLAFKEPVAAVGSTVDFIFSCTEFIITAIASVAMLLMLSPKAFLILPCALPILIFSAKHYGSRIMKFYAKEQEDQASLRAILTGSINAYRTVNIFSLKDKIHEKSADYFGRYEESSLARIKNEKRFNVFNEKFFQFFLLACYTLCGIMMLRGEMTFGSVMAFITAVQYAAYSIMQMAMLFPEYGKISAGMERLAGLYAKYSADSAEQKKTELITSEQQEAKELSLRNISFSYGEHKIIDSLSMELKPGDKLMLEGGNGSGKSTIANIICGFLNPQAGNAQRPDISNISACIMPHGFIPGTLADNINYKKLKPEEKIYADNVLKKFDLDGKINENPDNFSAGQQKKAEVLTGLMKKADLYIFDEPLANVDEDSKETIMQEIISRSKNAALIVIMHGDDRFRPCFNKEIRLKERTA